jgi:hypothetical protein
VLGNLRSREGEGKDTKGLVGMDFYVKGPGEWSFFKEYSDSE